MVLRTRFFLLLNNLQITVLDDDGPVSFDLPSPVFLARNCFKPLSVLFEASEVVTRARRRPFQVLKGGMCYQDGDEGDAVLHGELDASDGLVWRLSYP
jgi:hypothetical protein